MRYLILVLVSFIYSSTVLSQINTESLMLFEEYGQDNYVNRLAFKNENSITDLLDSLVEYKWSSISEEWKYNEKRVYEYNDRNLEIKYNYYECVEIDGVERWQDKLEYMIG